MLKMACVNANRWRHIQNATFRRRFRGPGCGLLDIGSIALPSPERQLYGKVYYLVPITASELELTYLRDAHNGKFEEYRVTGMVKTERQKHER